MNINTETIFTATKSKEIRSMFEDLKNDLNYISATRYSECYKDVNLRDFLFSSEYIFREPFIGIDKYFINFIFGRPFPFHRYSQEFRKFEDYVINVLPEKSPQFKKYNDYLEKFKKYISELTPLISLSEEILIEVETQTDLYNAAWKYLLTKEQHNLEELKAIFNDSNYLISLLDAINVSLYIEELQPDLFLLIKNHYFQPNDLKCNFITHNIVKRIFSVESLKNKFMDVFSENLKVLISTILDFDESIIVDKSQTKLKPSEVVSSSNPVMDSFEDDIYDEAVEELNLKIKLENLIFEKELVDISLAFTLSDYMCENVNDDNNEEISVYFNHSVIAQRECDENKKPYPINSFEQLQILQNISDELKKKIEEIKSNLTEAYFNPDGGPSKVIHNSVGDKLSDSNMKKKDDDDEEEKHEYIKHGHYSDDEDEEDDDKEDKPIKKVRPEDVGLKTGYLEAKYSNLSDNDYDDEDEDAGNEPVKHTSQKDFEIPEKPQKRNIFQRIQNKSLDVHSKYLRKSSEAKRLGTDAKNAAKASTKIPVGIAASISNALKDLDRMDDDRRKAYMIQPGIRKKWLKFFKIGLAHYLTFHYLGPVFNIYLALVQKAGAMKNTRIRTELIRELKAEIKVTEEKIEDAKSQGETKKKYQLMRIKERLEAELARVISNSTAI